MFTNFSSLSLCFFGAVVFVIFILTAFLCYLSTKSKKLEASHQYLTLAYDLIPDAFCIQDQASGDLLKFNRKFLKMYACPSSEQPIRLNWEQFSSGVSPYTNENMQIWIKKALQEGSQTFSWHSRRCSGELFWTRISLHKIQLDRNQCVMFVIHDVAEYENFMQTITSALTQHYLYGKQTKSFAWAVDLKGYYTSLSPKVFEITKYRPDELIGKIPFYRLHPQEGGSLFKNKQMEWLTEAKSFANMIHPVLAKTGEIIWLSTTGTSLRDKSGKLIGGCGTSIDITNLKYIDQAQVLLKERLTHSQMLESVGRFAGTVAHDFNNLLQGILGYVDLAIEQIPPNENLYNDLMEARKSAERASVLSRQLQVFARQRELAPTLMPLNQTIENILDILKMIVGNKTQLVWEPAPKPGSVLITPNHLTQILVNLCANARDALKGKDEGKVTIVASIYNFENKTNDTENLDPGTYAVLSVSDNGCGMSPEIRERVFDPFFSTKEKKEGSGLGLPVVLGIVSQNKGQILLESEPGKGSTFRIYLPIRTKSPSAKPDTPEQMTRKPASSGTILLIDDDQGVLITTQRVLERLNYKVIAVSSSKNAVKIYQQYMREIDLVIADVVMPEISGPEIISNMQQLSPELKYFFISGHSATFLNEQGVPGTQENYLAKPFTPEALINKVSSILSDN